MVSLFYLMLETGVITYQEWYISQHWQSLIPSAVIVNIPLVTDVDLSAVLVKQAVVI